LTIQLGRFPPPTPNKHQPPHPFHPQTGTELAEVSVAASPIRAFLQFVVVTISPHPTTSIPTPDSPHGCTKYYGCLDEYDQQTKRTYTLD
jgi:hypothetical protein